LGVASVLPHASPHPPFLHPISAPRMLLPLSLAAPPRLPRSSLDTHQLQLGTGQQQTWIFCCNRWSSSPATKEERDCCGYKGDEEHENCNSKYEP
ncbi:unnamed protein product, partial [Musa textilis]